MCIAATSKRRRRQAKNGYRHLGPKKRPVYVKRDPDTSARRLAKQIEKEKVMRTRKKK